MTTYTELAISHTNTVRTVHVTRLVNGRVTYFNVLKAPAVLEKAAELLAVIGDEIDRELVTADGLMVIEG